MPFFQISIKNSELKTTHNTFRDCRVRDWPHKTAKKTSLSRSLQTFRGFCQVHFTILLQIQHGNNFLPTSEHRQAKVLRFLGICLCDYFNDRTNFVFRKCLETSRHFGSCRKTVNSQGYSELREPIKTRGNCYSLI